MACERRQLGRVWGRAHGLLRFHLATNLLQTIRVRKLFFSFCSSICEHSSFCVSVNRLPTMRVNNWGSRNYILKVFCKFGCFSTFVTFCRRVARERMPGLHFHYADLEESVEKVPPGEFFLFKRASCDGNEQTLLECDIGDLWDTEDCSIGTEEPCDDFRDDVYLFCSNFSKNDNTSLVPNIITNTSIGLIFP